MVTALPVESIMERFGNHGLDDETTVTVLSEMGIHPINIPHIAGPLFIEGATYLASVPSLNNLGGAHAIIIEVGEIGDATVYDPNEGRDGTQWYRRDALHPTRDYTGPILRRYTEALMLKSLRLHQGTRKRMLLYAARKGE